MPRSRRSRRVASSPRTEDEVDVSLSQQENNDEDEEANRKEEEPPPSRTRRQRKSSITHERSGKRRSIVDEEDDEARKEGDEADEDEEDASGGTTGAGVEIMFSSQVPEICQEIAPVRAGDRNNLNRLGEEAREKAIGDLLQLVLMKGLAREPIDRQKVIKEAGISDARISSAAFAEVNHRLQLMFDFKLAPVPAFLQSIKDFPNKYKDRYYLLNIAQDADGSHSRALHSVSQQGILEKGLLMVVLGFIFCQGGDRKSVV